MKIRNNIFILCSLFFFNFQQGISQEFSFKSEDFNNDKIELTAEEKELDGIILFQDRKVEIIPEGETTRQFFLYHEQILVNSDKSIEENNKIYIGFSRNSKIITNKNRVILPNGKTIELNKNDIHEEVDQETGYKYQYYAVKGLEKGAIIEKLYIKEETPTYSGRSYYFQKGYPIKKSTFQLIFPSYLTFKHKSYNGLPEGVLTEDEENETKVIEIVAENLDAEASSEKLSNPAIHEKKFRYKLFENAYSGERNFFNYKQFAKNLFSKYDFELDKQEKAELIEFFKYVLVSTDEKKNILNIENEIKNRIRYNKSFDENKSLKDIFKNKQANLVELMILYRQAFDYFGVKSEFILTSDRFEYPFDSEFETSSSLSDVLIYFPNSDQYLDFANMSLRSPLISPGLGNTEGIKIKEVSFSGNKMATSESIFIELPEGKITHDTMRIMADLTKDIENPLVNTKITFGGYSNSNLQPLKTFLDEKQYNNALLEIGKTYTSDIEIDSISLEDDGMKNVGKKNVKADIKYHSGDLVQNAGDKILYKVGNLIGKQDEIYTDQQRTLPIELRYKRYYTRYITLLIPEDYTISNPEILNLDHRLEEKGETVALFSSSYKMDGNKLIIENNEHYSKIEYSLKEFEEFRKVYNAAADFNKLTLVLEKK